MDYRYYVFLKEGTKHDIDRKNMCEYKLFFGR